MNQKEKIIEALRKTPEMTQGDLSEYIYGDRRHLPNIYCSLQNLVKKGVIDRKGAHPAYYSLSSVDKDDVFIQKESPIREINIVRNAEKSNVPRPCKSEVEFYLNEWEKLEDYRLQEEAIDELFDGKYNSNDNIKNILIKCSVLNDFYSTNIFKIFPVAKHILSLNIDDRLKNGDLTLVNEIALIEISGKAKDFYSFASKYCSHHKPLIYPIYDSYVDKMLNYFRRQDNFADFDKADLKTYTKFKDILMKFKDFYALNEFNLKQIDRYLWLAGKKHFPKNYKGKKK